MLNSDLDDRLEVLIAVFRAHVPWIDSKLCQGGCSLRVGGKQLMPVVVEVTNDRRCDTGVGESLDETWYRRGSLLIVHRHANDLTPSTCEMRNLFKRAGHICGISVCH